MNAYKRLHYSPFDYLIVLAGLFCILMGAYFFNSSFTDSKFRTGERFGTVNEGEGTRKLSNSLQWFEVNKNNPLYYGDVIFANNGKDIKISLLDQDLSLIHI